jgi:hypothetical protein
MLDILIIIFIIILIIIIILFASNKSFNSNNSNNYNISCYWRRWGCCNDNLTPKLDIFGSNCRGF